MLETKRAQALEALRRAFGDVEDPDDWISLTELSWQLMSEKVKADQFEVIRHERFEHGNLLSRPGGAIERLEKHGRYQRALRALNFFLKCFDVDWGAFIDTAIALAEGKIDAAGLDSAAERSQPQDEADSAGQRDDDSAAGG